MGVVGRTEIAVSDQEGRFTFSVRSPGRYYISGGRDGYLEDSMVLDGRGDVEFVLHEGENRTVVFYLVPEASMTGRIMDEAGKPVANVSVAAVREEYAHGKQFFRPCQNRHGPRAGKTDKYGEYHIGKLGPGKYYIEAFLDYFDKPEDSFLAKGYFPVYYPNAARIRSATPFFLAAGDRRQADFHLVARGTHYVRGKLVISPATPASEPLWAVYNEYGELVHKWSDNFDPQTRSFDVGPLAPGPYVLQVASGIYPGDPIVRHHFEITDCDIEGLVLHLHPAFTLNADVHLPYTIASKPPLTLLRLQADGSEFDESGEPLTKGGMVSFREIQPGRYSLFLLTDEPIYVKSVRLGAQEIFAGRFTISGPPLKSLVVEVSRALGEVHGTVVNADGKFVADADVKLLAKGEDSQYVLRSMNTDHVGHFRISGVPFGRYSLLALSRPVRDAQLGPLELARLLNHIKQIQLDDSTRLNVQIQVSVFRP